MDNLTTCQVVQLSERASDMKKFYLFSRLCEAMLRSPWPIILYAVSVLFVMYSITAACPWTRI